MPYKSEKQRRFMHAQEPEVAARWDRKHGGKKKVKGKKGRRGEGPLHAAMVGCAT